MTCIICGKQEKFNDAQTTFLKHRSMIDDELLSKEGICDECLTEELN